MTGAERNRQSQNQAQYRIPKHADTMPASSSSKAEGRSPTIQDRSIDPFPEQGRWSAEKSQSSGGTNSDETNVEQDTVEAPVALAESNEENPTKKRKSHLPSAGKKEPIDDVGQPQKKKRSLYEKSLFKKSKDGQKFTVASQIRGTILNSYVNILLLFVPVGIAVNYAGVSQIAVFVINFIAIIPLAGMLSYATEEIALRVGETIGGLLNATFGYGLP